MYVETYRSPGRPVNTDDDMERIVLDRPRNAQTERLKKLIKRSLEESIATDPDVAVQVSFVTYGYQVDVLVKGEVQSISCRDFGGDYPINRLISYFLWHVEEMVEKFRKSEKKFEKPLPMKRGGKSFTVRMELSPTQIAYAKKEARKRGLKLADYLREFGTEGTYE